MPADATIDLCRSFNRDLPASCTCVDVNDRSRDYEAPPGPPAVRWPWSLEILESDASTVVTGKGNFTTKSQSCKW